jgi:hypothetical protein
MLTFPGSAVTPIMRVRLVPTCIDSWQNLLKHKHLIGVHSVNIIVEDFGDVLKPGVSNFLALLYDRVRLTCVIAQ